MTELDATENVLIENLHACDAGKVRSGYVDAVTAEKNAKATVQNIITIWGPMLVANELRRRCKASGPKYVQTACDLLVEQLKRCEKPVVVMPDEKPSSVYEWSIMDAADEWNDRAKADE